MRLGRRTSPSKRTPSRLHDAITILIVLLILMAIVLYFVLQVHILEGR